MRATVVKPQVRGREAGDERSGRQNCDPRNTNRQGGRVRAASVLGNAKPKAHQDAPGRAGGHAAKVQILTRGDLFCESRGEVSKGRSSVEAPRKRGRAKGRSSSNMAQPRAFLRGERPLERTEWHLRPLPWTGRTRQNRCSRGELKFGGAESSRKSGGHRKP